MNPIAIAIRSTPVASWRWGAVVAAVFTVLVGIAMMVAHLEHKSSDPWKSPHLLALKEQLRAEPRNEPLKSQIRALDLQLRERYFRLLSFKASGVYLLFGGVGLFLIAAGQIRLINKRPHLPKLNPAAAAEWERSRGQSRMAIAGCGAVVMATFVALALGSKSPLPAGPVEAARLLGGEASEATVPVIPDCASDEELRRNWPGFRGFDGSGVAVATNIPAQLDEASLLWKVESPGVGFNSPLAFGDRVFFTGGDAKLREVFCLSAATGQLLWRQAVANVPGSPAAVPEIDEMTGYCAPTAATDGRRIYAWFATGDIAAFSLEGQLVWSRFMGAPHNLYGHAISLRTWQDRVILQFDQGEPEDRLSKLLALDGRTGRTLWEKPRPVGASWASPIVANAANRSQIVTLALPFVISYAANDGAELWRAEVLDGEITPSPVLAGGRVVVVSPASKLMALNPDGTGDVTQSKVSWTVEEYLPDISSPVSDGELVFTVTSSGLLACFDAKDGQKLWEHDFEMEVHASPAIAEGRVYVIGTHGEVMVTGCAREFAELSRGKLDDKFFASPAFADGRIYVRGNQQVWCFGGRSEAVSK